MSDLIKDLDHWTAEMDRAASTAEQEGLGLEIIDGNRACATVLRNAAKALVEAFKASAYWQNRTHALGDELCQLQRVMGAQGDGHALERKAIHKDAAIGEGLLREALRALQVSDLSAENQREQALNGAFAGYDEQREALIARIERYLQVGGAVLPPQSREG